MTEGIKNYLQAKTDPAVDEIEQIISLSTQRRLRKNEYALRASLSFVSNLSSMMPIRTFANSTGSEYRPPAGWKEYLSL